MTFLDAIGRRIEKLIDSIPILGVPTPVQPWSPLIDKKAAVLSDPIVILKTFFKWDQFSFARLLEEHSLYLVHAKEGKAEAKQKRDDLSMEEEPLLSDEECAIVTSDDASVERSVASFADLNTDEESFAECPSVVTECQATDAVVVEKEMKDLEVNVTRETQDVSDDDMMTDDENEYVLAEEPNAEEEGFVDLGAEA